MMRIPIAIYGALMAAQTSADILHFANGDRLTGKLVEAPPGFVAIDVAQIGVVTAPDALVARVEPAVPATVSEPESETATPPIASPDWETRADLGLVIARGNTRTEHTNLTVTSKRSGERFDNFFGAAVRKSAAQADAASPRVTIKDQFDLDYDLRWKYRDAWYGVANFEYFRDSLKDIDRRYTAGAGFGHVFWESVRGSLSADAGISQVFEQLDRGEDGRRESDHNPALRWSLMFKRWLVPDRLEVFHNNQLLHILSSARNSVWDSDTGIRFHVNSHWQAGLRLDLQHDTEPAAGRDRTDASYTVAIGVKL